MTRKTLLISFIILLVVGIGAAYWWNQSKIGQQNQNEAANWKTFTSIEQGVTFRYPENLLTTYIHLQEWPPKVLITDSAEFSCEQGGLGIDGRPGMTIQKEINDTVYCIESVSEGAAGTFYTDYTYSFLKDNRLIKLEFTLAYPQCENYDDPQKTVCEQERQIFDLDALINRIAETVQLSKS